ncbi:MAG TPA: PAS domain S-box protein [Burkholderiales bacterium]|nr:PAS domain S-box protein [Burkholderiales bacterium]
MDSPALWPGDAGRQTVSPIDHSPLPALIVDPQSLAILAVNDAAVTRYGYSRKEFLTKTIRDVRPQEDLRELLLYIEQMPPGEASNGRVCQHVTKDGAPFDVEVFWYEAPFHDRCVLLGLVYDLTERNRLYEALNRHEHEFKALIENSSDIVSRLDRGLRYCYINLAIEKVTGLSREALLGKTKAQIGMLPRDIYRPWDEKCLEAFATGAETQYEFSHVSQNGLKYYSVRIVPEFNKDGVVAMVLNIVHDVTARKQAELELSDFVENAPLGMNCVGANGRVIWANHAELDLLGYAPEEYIGHSFSRFHIDQELIQGVMRRLLSGDSLGSFETRVRAKDGSIKHLEISSNALMREGKCIHIRCFSRDITARKRAEDALRESEERFRLLAAEAEMASRAAKTASRAKDEFLATLSHELRTPLNAILGWTQTLRSDDPQQEHWRRALAAIEQSAQAQAKLIDDLLSVSDIISGKLRLDAQPTKLPPLIAAAIESMRPAMAAKRIQLETDFDSHSCAVYGDPIRLQQIVWNLLSNAVKFTPKKGHVRVSLERVHSQVKLVVADSGEGISADFLPYVFDRFRQADASSKRRHGGLGLGLAIVRHLVEMHGGAVSADSPGDGKGAVFTVLFPISSLWQMSSFPTDPMYEGMPSAARSDEVGRRLRGLRILSVDDDFNTREMLQEALEHAGAEVVSAASANDALGKLKSFRPDVLVSDIGMPEEDGYDLVRQVRALPHEQGGETPAIALTGYAREQDRLATSEAGYQAFMPKPVNLPELLSTIIAVTKC